MSEKDNNPVSGTSFDLENFFKTLVIEPTEQAAVHQALLAGIGRYQALAGETAPANPLQDLQLNLLHSPRIFGYGAIEVSRHRQISAATKVKIAYYACQMTDPFADDGIPYGLIQLVSIIGTHGALQPELFRSVWLALELAGERQWGAGWQQPEARLLSDWLIAHTTIPAEEKLWWLWHIATHLRKQASLGGALVKHWLEHEGLTVEARRALAWGWARAATRVGTPPPAWRLMEASLAGDPAAVETALADMNIDLTAEPETETEISAPEGIVLPVIAAEPDPFAFLRLMMKLRFGQAPAVPPYIRRMAVSYLVRLGENPAEVSDLILSDSILSDSIPPKEQDKHRNALFAGVADILRDFGDQIAPAERRALIDRAVQVTPASDRLPVAARLAFYRLGADLYGDAYRQRAAADPAKSIRDWATSQING